jgi:hypothetical protein
MGLRMATRTRAPRFASARTTCVPMKPEPPKTTTSLSRMNCSVSADSGWMRDAHPRRSRLCLCVSRMKETTHFGNREIAGSARQLGSCSTGTMLKTPG